MITSPIIKNSIYNILGRTTTTSYLFPHMEKTLQSIVINSMAGWHLSEEDGLIYGAAAGLTGVQLPIVIGYFLGKTTGAYASVLASIGDKAFVLSIAGSCLYGADGALLGASTGVVLDTIETFLDRNIQDLFYNNILEGFDIEN